MLRIVRNEFKTLMNLNEKQSFLKNKKEGKTDSVMEYLTKLTDGIDY